jgi:hypothetical protein
VFSRSLYIQVRENRFEVRNVDVGRAVQHHASPGFSHPRMLVGDFTLAQSCLKSLVAQARGSGFVLSVAALVHPLEKIEGGLTQVEERLFEELAIGAGVSRAVVWIGAPLSDAEVVAKLKGA